MATKSAHPGGSREVQGGAALSRAAIGLGGAGAAIGLAVLAGWVLEVEALLRLDPRLPAMQFNAALALALSGVGAMAWAGRRERLQRVAGAAVALLGGLTTLQFLLGRSFGIDTLFWTPFVVNPRYPAGRMAPSTAAAYLLLGAALLASVGRRRWTTASGVAASGALAVTLSTFSEFAFGRGVLSPWGRFAGMALHTAIGLGASSAAILCLAWRDGRRRGGFPVWLPWTMGAGTLAIVALLATTLVVRFPADAATLILATTMFLGACLAALVTGATHLSFVARERADAYATVSASHAQAERALQESERRLRLALENASHGLWDWTVETGELVVDERWSRILGYAPGEAPARVEAWEATIHEDDRARVHEHLQRSLACDDVLYDVDYRARCRDGRVAWINTRGRVQARDAGGKPLRMIGTIHDVTARKQAEEQIRLSLQEKEVLLREVHHRVKNNLAVMSSLFYLESETTRDPAALRLLDDSRNRIQSMALVHELLYHSESLASIDLAEYATTLAHELLGSLRQPRRSIGFETAVVPTLLTIDTAIPCGLVLNELLTNCVKHAFEGPDPPASPTIRLDLSRGPDGVSLVVTDNGVGLGGVDPAQAHTLGLRLVRSLARQIDASLTYEDANPGTRVRVLFRERAQPGGAVARIEPHTAAPAGP